MINSSSNASIRCSNGRATGTTDGEQYVIGFIHTNSMQLYYSPVCLHQNCVHPLTTSVIQLLWQRSLLHRQHLGLCEDLQGWKVCFMSRIITTVGISFSSVFYGGLPVSIIVREGLVSSTGSPEKRRQNDSSKVWCSVIPILKKLATGEIQHPLSISEPNYESFYFFDTS